MIADKIVQLPFGAEKGNKFILKAMSAWAEFKLCQFAVSAISRGSRDGGEYQSAVSIASVVEYVKSYSPDDADIEIMVTRILGLISDIDQNTIIQKLYESVKFLNTEGKEIDFLPDAHITDPRNHFFLIAESIKARINFYKGVSG